MTKSFQFTHIHSHDCKRRIGSSDSNLMKKWQVSVWLDATMWSVRMVAWLKSLRTRLCTYCLPFNDFKLNEISDHYDLIIISSYQFAVINSLTTRRSYISHPKVSYVHINIQVCAIWCFMYVCMYEWMYVCMYVCMYPCKIGLNGILLSELHNLSKVPSTMKWILYGESLNV